MKRLRRCLAAQLAGEDWTAGLRAGATGEDGRIVYSQLAGAYAGVLEDLISRLSPDQIQNLLAQIDGGEEAIRKLDDLREAMADLDEKLQAMDRELGELDKGH
jgi:hypothetical protein